MVDHLKHKMSPGLPTSIQAGSRLESYSFLRSIHSSTSDIAKQNDGKGRALRNNRLEAPVKSNQSLIKECFPSLGERNQTVWFHEHPSCYGLAAVVSYPFCPILDERVFTVDILCFPPPLYIRRMKNRRRQNISGLHSSYVSSPRGHSC